MATLSQFLLAGILLFLTLAFGFWVSLAGRPYNGLLFNVHKLVALGAVVVTVLQLARTLKAAPAPALIAVLLGLAALSVLALFASGALLSASQRGVALMLLVHRVAPAVLVVALALAVYLLGRTV
jgi:hypothetical protein